MRMDAVRGPDAATLLVRAIRAQSTMLGLTIVVRSIASCPWASATFGGMRHQLMLKMETGRGVKQWLADLPEIEWTLRRHLVADVTVETVQETGEVTTVTLSILTLAED